MTKTERECAFAIKTALNLPDVISAYTGSHVKEKGRIRCPLHNGTDRNFSVGAKRYKCFSCGANGDVIAFVMEFFGTDFFSAMRRLNGDFHMGLPIDGANNASAKSGFNAALRKRMADELEKQAEAKRKNERYEFLMGEWIRLSRALIEKAPENAGSEISDEFAEACRDISLIEYALDNEDLQV